MNTTTGNLYLQVYNAASNKYIEIPSTIGTFGFGAAQISGYSDYQTNNFSGFIFSRPVKLPGIEMMPIGIGINNSTGQQLFGINIGSNNANRFTILNYITGNNGKGFVGATNLGYQNGALNSLVALNLGAGNYSDYSDYSINLGSINSISGSDISLNAGYNNSITSGDTNFIFGTRNVLFSGSTVFIFGALNNLNIVESSNILGDSNVIQNTNNNNFLGSSNTFNYVNNSLNLGDTNTVYNSSFIKILNDNNNIYDSNYETIIGPFNIISGSNQELILGSSNIGNVNSGNFIIGDSNNFQFSPYNNIYGSNILILNSKNNNIFGSFNSASGLLNSTVLGTSNTLDSSIVNLLYRIELTGITGLGVNQTRFTGVTGYLTLNGYNDLDANGGNNNFIIGKQNATSLNDNSYIFGNNNQVLNNTNSYIFGTNNYLEKNINSYAFGENNSVSGFKNYVIGNNNSVRSGDYNSILIGISHEFTGNYKLASINIASIDSSIEVNPSDIKLRSSNRPKINDEDITIQSDLAEYAKKTEITPTSGIFNSLKFYDPSYNRLADQVELQTFAYSGKEIRYSAAFSGKNSSYNTIYFDGFFREQPISYYTGAFVVQGNKYYWSNDLNYNIIFSNTMTSSGSWMLTSSHNFDTFFYNKSTNTGVFPMTNWIKTGYNIAGLGGLSKGTGITITNFSFNNAVFGIFTGEVLNGSQNLTLKSFNIFSTTSYSSPLQGISVIYGNHTNPKFTPTWLVVDNFSSGIYYRNDNYNATQTPQSGWIVTGFLGYTGRDSYLPDWPYLNGTYGMKLSMGTRQAVIRSSDPTLGTVYIPIYY